MLISKNLFDLIKSLTGSEKRYIKINLLKEKGAKEYIQLFDLYIHLTEKLSDFDKKKEGPELEKKVAIKKINYFKHQLYKKIIVSLQDFSTSKTTKISNDINAAKIIFNKGLYIQCRDLIIQIKKDSIKYEQSAHFVDILELENKLNGILAPELNWSKNKELYLFALNNIERDIQYTKTRAILNSILKQNNVLKESVLKNKFIKSYNDCSPSFSKTPFSFISNNYYFEINSIYFSGIKDYSQLLINAKKHFRYFQKNTHLVYELIPVGFITVFQKYVEALLHYKKYKPVEQLIDKIKKSKIILTKNNSPVISNYAQSLILRTEMILMLERKKFNDVANLYQRVTDFHKLFSKYKATSSSISLLFILARILFYSANFKLALGVIEQILAEKEEFGRADIRAAALLLKMLTLFELNDYATIKSTEKQLELFLEQNKWLGKKEKIVLNYFAQKITIQDDTKKQLTLLKELKTELHIHGKVELFSFEHYLNLNDWIEEKIDKLLLAI